MPRRGLLIACGCLAPGRDGVGDHVQRLAGELARRGVDVSLLALADRYVTGVERPPADAAGTQVPTMRLSADLPWEVRVAEAERFVAEREPQLLSMHLVPWPYGRRGVVGSLGKDLRRLGGPRPWHVMAHELWVHGSSRRRQNVLGLVQRRALKNVFRDLAPRRTHVTTSRNARLLETIGVEAGVLPLFGNLDIAGGIEPRDQDDTLQVISFGSLPLEGVDRLIESVCDVARDRPVRFVVAGGAEAARRGFVTELASRLPLSSRAVDAGFLDADDMSRLITRSDVGLGRSRPFDLGKNSALITLLEHGLPVWAPLWHGEPLELPFRAHLLHSNLREAAAAEREVACSFLPAVVDHFLKDVGLDV